jgi:hypothetical protein
MQAKHMTQPSNITPWGNTKAEHSLPTRTQAAARDNPPDVHSQLRRQQDPQEVAGGDYPDRASQGVDNVHPVHARDAQKLQHGGDGVCGCGGDGGSKRTGGLALAAQVLPVWESKRIRCRRHGIGHIW